MKRAEGPVHVIGHDHRFVGAATPLLLLLVADITNLCGSLPLAELYSGRRQSADARRSNRCACVPISVGSRMECHAYRRS